MIGAIFSNYKIQMTLNVGLDTALLFGSRIVPHYKSLEALKCIQMILISRKKITSII